MQLPSAVANIDSDYAPTVFILPALEGTCIVHPIKFRQRENIILFRFAGISQQIETLSLTLKAHVFCAVYPLNDSPQSVGDLANYFLTVSKILVLDLIRNHRFNRIRLCRIFSVESKTKKIST